MVTLRLKNHCIETESKREYERLIKKYFSKSITNIEKTAIEKQVEVLKFFLETADFSFLRSSYLELTGKNEIPVTINWEGDTGNITFIVNDRVREIEWIGR